MSTPLALPIDSSGIGMCLAGANRRAGLQLANPKMEGTYPWLPENVNPATLFTRGVDRGRLLDEQHTDGFSLPTVLVEDVVIFDSHHWRTRRNRTAFTPYYTPEILILQQGQGCPDLHAWREPTTIEAACCIAQYGAELGSVRFGGRQSGWHQDSAQAYLDETRDNMVSVNCDGSNRLHHRMFVRMSHAPSCSLEEC